MDALLHGTVCEVDLIDWYRGMRLSILVRLIARKTPMYTMYPDTEAKSSCGKRVRLMNLSLWKAPSLGACRGGHNLHTTHSSPACYI